MSTELETLEQALLAGQMDPKTYELRRAQIENRFAPSRLTTGRSEQVPDYGGALANLVKRQQGERELGQLDQQHERSRQARVQLDADIAKAVGPIGGVPRELVAEMIRRGDITNVAQAGMNQSRAEREAAAATEEAARAAAKAEREQANKDRDYQLDRDRFGADVAHRRDTLTAAAREAERTATTPKPKTAGEQQAQSKYLDMMTASRQLGELEAAGDVNTGSRKGQVLAGVGGLVGANVSDSGSDYNKYKAAALAWSANMLYAKSGAAATEGEVLRTFAMYFPRPGDSDEVIEQKRAARAEAETNMGTALGITDQPRGPGTVPASPSQNVRRAGGEVRRYSANGERL